MAAVLSQYPSRDAEAFVRGDPAAFIMRVSEKGVDLDISSWTWRSHVRSGWDTREPLSVCADFEVVTPDDLPDLFTTGGTTPCVLIARWTEAQTVLWRDGYVSDIEQLTPNKYTWLIIEHLSVAKDATHTELLP